MKSETLLGILAALVVLYLAFRQKNTFVSAAPAAVQARPGVNYMPAFFILPSNPTIAAASNPTPANPAAPANPIAPSNLTSVLPGSESSGTVLVTSGRIIAG